MEFKNISRFTAEEVGQLEHKADANALNTHVKGFIRQLDEIFGFEKGLTIEDKSPSHGKSDAFWKDILACSQDIKPHNWALTRLHSDSDTTQLVVTCSDSEALF